MHWLSTLLARKGMGLGNVGHVRAQFGTNSDMDNCGTTLAHRLFQRAANVVKRNGVTRSPQSLGHAHPIARWELESNFDVVPHSLGHRDRAPTVVIQYDDDNW